MAVPDRGRASPLRLIENGVRAAVGGALLLMAVLTTIDAIARYALGASLPGAARITELYLMPAVVFLTWAAAQRNRRHVTVSILRQRFRGLSARISDVVVDLLGLFLFVLVLLTSLRMVTVEGALWTVEDPSLPVGPSRLIVAVGAVLMILRLAAQIVWGRTAADEPEPDVPEGDQ